MPRFQPFQALLSSALLPFYTVSNSPARTSGRPPTVPALKEWTDAPASYTFGPGARIVLSPASAAQLASTAEVLAEDLSLLTGLRIPIVIAEEVSPGDIVLALNPADTTLGSEGYQLVVSETVKITAAADSGAFYATRTLLQLLKQGSTINGGLARDWPDYPERGLMVDVGRKYFSLSWLESHLRDLAYLKYNYFHFHLSDTFGFRLASERHPEIVSQQHYSKAEISQLITLARKYHINIVPEIDMPAHMNTILDAHPELRLTNPVLGLEKLGDIDLTQEATYELARDLLEEFLPLFPGPYWHLGADEYLYRDTYENYPQLLTYAQQHYGPSANARDTYLGFVNWAHDIVKAHGKIARAWSDGLHGGSVVSIAPDIIFEHWLNWGFAPQEIIDGQRKIMNSNANLLYYVPGIERWQANPGAIYETFEPHVFYDNDAIASLHPQNLGAKLHVWCDYPDRETEAQIANGIEGALRALAQKNWGSPLLVSNYTSFVPIYKRIGRAPGYVLS